MAGVWRNDQTQLVPGVIGCCLSLTLFFLRHQMVTKRIQSNKLISNWNVSPPTYSFLSQPKPQSHRQTGPISVNLHRQENQCFVQCKRNRQAVPAVIYGASADRRLGQMFPNSSGPLSTYLVGKRKQRHPRPTRLTFLTWWLY